MATPRYQLVDEEHAACYHVTSRCVRRAWLFGYDRVTQRDYSYRKRWVVDRMKQLAKCFAVEIFGYAVMNNHFHLVLHYDPKACESWSDEEVARRWVEASSPRTKKGHESEHDKAQACALMLDDPERLARARRTLGSLSLFMKHLKQPIARRANLENGCTGHFFDQRFYSGALLSKEALLAAMVYVDLNPVRAGKVRELIKCRDTSIGERLQEHNEQALEEYLAPLASGLDNGDDAAAPLPVTLGAYIEMLQELVAAATGTEDPPDRVARWTAWVTSFRKRQRAYGSNEELQHWRSAPGMQPRQVPLPG